MLLRIWNIETQKVIKSFPLRKNMYSANFEEGGVDRVRFISNNQLITAGHGGVRLWNLEDGSNESVLPSTTWMGMSISNDAKHIVARELDGGIPIFFDLTNRSSFLLTKHGKGTGDAIALNRNGNIIVSGSSDGIVRVGSIKGEEPHLLYGHKSEVACLEMSPDGNWIASGGSDGTVQLWPMPEGKPFHTLPYEELLSHLHELTNVRAVRDEKSSTGYHIAIEKFPGWEKVPTW
jgi:WD40 repeat protein